MGRASRAKKQTRATPMDRRLLYQFQCQSLLLCDFILIAAEDLTSALTTPRGYGQTYIFYCVQGLVNAAANLSKVLWGPGGIRALERLEVRQSIDVTDDSPLRQVGMRNHFEHFDERLEQWLSTSKRHNAADVIVGPASAIRDLDDIDRFRIFDDVTWELFFWGERFDLRGIVSEVQLVAPALRAIVAAGPQRAVEPTPEE